jgi:Zn-finger nucleic acid-binding protein
VPLVIARANQRDDRRRAERPDIHTCARCGGVWLNQELAEELSAALEQKIALAFEEEATLIGDEAARRALLPDVDTARADLPCPICRAPMQRVRIARAYLEVDSCSSHGTWFDRGEMQRVARSLKDCGTTPVRPAAPPPRASGPTGSDQARPFLGLAPTGDERALETAIDVVIGPETGPRCQRDSSLIDAILAFFFP